LYLKDSKFHGSYVALTWIQVWFQDGGAFYLDNSQVVVDHAEFTLNGIVTNPYPDGTHVGCGGVAYLRGNLSSFEATTSVFNTNIAPKGGSFCLADMTQCTTPKVKLTNSTWLYDAYHYHESGLVAYFDGVPLPDCLGALAINDSSNSYKNTSHLFGSQPYSVDVVNSTIPKFPFSPTAPIEIKYLIEIKDYFGRTTDYNTCFYIPICAMGHNVNITNEGEPFYCDRYNRIFANISIPAGTAPGIYDIFFGNDATTCKNLTSSVITRPVTATFFEITAPPVAPVTLAPMTLAPKSLAPVSAPVPIESPTSPEAVQGPAPKGLDTPIIVIICVAAGIVLVVGIATIVYIIRRRAETQEEQLPLIR